MKPTTPLLVALVIGALGAGTFWLATTQGQDDVRFVEQVLADPAAHRTGAFTVMGIPQPAQTPFAGPNGTVLAENPAYSPVTVWTTSWSHAGTTYYSTHTLELASATAAAPAHGQARLVHTNTTRLTPADPTPVSEPVRSVIELEGDLFPVEAFRDGRTQRIWAVLPQAPENPIQPKPSQLRGHLLAEVGGVAVPDGANILWVEEYTAGCSSKFLPPELQDKYDDDGDPVA